MKTIMKRLLMALFAASITPSLTFADTTRQQTTDDTDLLDEVVVTTTRYNDSAFNIPVGITVVDQQELLERSSRTAAEALRQKPGIWIQKTGHLGGSPVIRGFIGARVIYLFDGIRRNTAGLFKGPNSFLQNIDALDIDRVEVIRGPGSVLYGSDAIGGVVNVITNEKPVFSPEYRFGGRLYGRYGTVDQETSGRIETYVSGPKLYAFVGGTSRDISDLKAGGDIGEQIPSSWEESNWDAQIDYLPGDGHQIQFFAQDFSRPIGRRFDRPNWEQKNDRQLFGMRYKGRSVGPMENLIFTAYHQSQQNFIDEKFFDSDSDEKTFGFEFQATSSLAQNLESTYGFSFYRDDIKKSNPQKGTSDPDVQWDNPAIFMLNKWQATDALLVEFGLRWDRFSLKSDPPPFDQLASTVQDAINNGSFSVDALDLDETDNAVTGAIGAVYSLTDHLNLVGHIGRSFRAPNKSDMLGFGQFSFGFNVPAAGTLDPESSWTYEIGLRAMQADYSGALTFFYTEIDDAIISRTGTFGGSDFVDVNGNGIKDSDEQVFVKGNSTGTIKAEGVELEGNYYFPSSWTSSLLGKGYTSIYGNFSWIYGKDTGENEPLDRAYPVNALVGLRWEDERNALQRKYWVAMEAWLVNDFSRIPSNRQFRDPAFRVDPQDRNSDLLRPDGSVPGFSTFSIRAGMNITRNVTVALLLDNLTDKKYRVKDSRIDAPGLNFVSSVNITF